MLTTAAQLIFIVAVYDAMDTTVKVLKKKFNGQKGEKKEGK